MKIIDTTTYFEEKLMMEIRFNILNDFVDKFVVCESNFTHSGKKKEISFNKKNYPKFEKKIIHLILDKEPNDIEYNIKDVDDPNIRLNSIKRIRHQRNYISSILNNFSGEDYIIYSDNDEIPDLRDFNFSSNKEKIILFKQKLFYYKFNLILKDVNWYGSKACRIKDVIDIDWLRNIKNKKYGIHRLDTLFSKYKFVDLKIVNKGGWHFSNLKNIDELERKYLNDENHFEHEKNKISKNDIESLVKNKLVAYNHKAKKIHLIDLIKQN